MTQETTTQNGAVATTDTQQAQNGGTTNADAKFTQADLDRIAGTTRATATEVARKKLLEELGIEDPDADKELLKAAKKRKADEQTEVERLAGETAKEKKRADDLQAEFETFKSQIETEQRTTKRDAAITKALTGTDGKQAAIPEDVITWAGVNASEALGKVLKEDGTVDAAAVTALVNKCREARPSWFKTGPGSPSNAGGHAVDPGSKDKQALQQRLEQRTRNLF